MLKKIVLFFVVAMGVLPLAAQIQFREVAFAEALKSAKAENKLVFMDCYTVWCGPCKRLASQVFSQQKAGDYFNARFVSLKVDMEKGEGVELGKKYDVNAYPTMLVLDVEGNLLWRYAGYLDVDKLIASVDKGIQGNGLVGMTKRYEAGERSYNFIYDYLEALNDAAMMSTLRTVAEDYLKDKIEVIFQKPEMYELFRAYTIPSQTVFQQVYARKAELAERYGEKAVEGMDRKWDSFGSRYLRREAKKTVGYDAEGLKAYHTLMKELNVAEADAIYGKYLQEGAIVTEDWPLALEALQAYATFSRLEIEEGTFNNACRKLSKQQDKKIRKGVKALVKGRLKAMKGRTDTTGRTMTVGDETMPLMEYYRRSYTELLKQMN